MRQSFYVHPENLDLWQLLDNKSLFVNEKLLELRRLLMVRRKIYDGAKDRSKKLSISKNNLLFVVIDERIYDLESHGINPALLDNNHIDILLAKQLVMENLSGK